MPKAKRGAVDTTDIPELAAADLRHARRAAPEETEEFRKAIERKLGVSRPPRMGRPPKHPSEKCVAISWRTPPEVKDWLIEQAHHAGIGRYQTFLSLLLRGMMRYQVVKGKNGEIVLKPVSRAPFEERSAKVREKMRALGLTEKDIRDAVEWGRRKPR